MSDSMIIHDEDDKIHSEDEVQHYTTKKDWNFSNSTGMEVPSICGKVWKPVSEAVHNPNLPDCEGCKR